MGTNNWCLFRGSNKVKTAIKFQMEQKQLSTSDVAKIIGVRTGRVSTYLNNAHKGGNPSITQEQLMRLAMALGLEVKVNVEFVS